MATYGRGQMLGSGINPESFKLDYSGMANAAATQAQGIANLGANIGNAINMVGDENKQINQNIAKGKSALAFAKANYPELAQRIDEIGKIFSDPNVSKVEQAAAGSQMGDFVTAMIRGQEFNTEIELRKKALGIEEAQNIEAAKIRQAEIEAAANKPGTIENIAVPGGIQQMVRNPRTGILEPIKVAENINTALNLPSSQGSQQLLDGNGTAIDGAPGVLPSINDPMNNAAEAIAYANGITGGRNDISNLSPIPTGVPANQPPQALRIDSLPSGAMPTTFKTPFGFTPTKGSEQETYEQNVEAGGLLGQRNTKTGEFKAYPGQTGGRITKFNPETGQFEIIEGSAAGVKEEKQKMAKENATEKAISLISDLNYLSDKAKSMAPGTVGALGRIVAEKIPATDQAENKQVIDRVRASLTLENLQAMRNNNPTGASLGTVSDKDTKLVEDSATALSNAQSPEAFQKEIIRLKNLQHDIIYGSERVLKNKLEKGEIKQADFDNAMAKAPAEYIDENGVIKSRKIQSIIPSSNSESVYEKYLSK